ncbi:alpha/beta fold hydrolase [Reyranella sp. CPCC 100927]|uniref:alpha/beta fold hydrolase n=1 Tax=Reyranella sp. CPCC 100927 TaxID=2599616 RepID=UPI0011B662F0|nr:alpha/beta hydrolase [Reyranella sp. CPCC 100927]TWS98493.1 alpha/beta hydrolase [Reyranella sp. CPCC 100927]
MSIGAGCHRRQVLGGAGLLTAALLAGDAAWSRQDSERSGAVQVDGVDVYYEVHGSALDGTALPLVLLHGGALTIETGFSPELIMRFARRRPVIAIEQQGHGHTADRPAMPFTIDQMVKDTAAVLMHLRVRKADLLGHSLGGMIATGMSIRYPDLVRTVTTLGAPYQLEGFRPDLVRLQRGIDATPSPALAKLLPTEADFAAWRASFQRVAPDPGAFDAILERLNTMLATWRGWTDGELRSIQAPTLVAIGDNDYVRIDHAADVTRLIPNARLVVLPGTTHLGIVKRESWLEPMIESLAQPGL